MRFLNRSARRLSRHRRSSLAGFVLMLLALVATGTLYTAFSPAQAEQAETDAELVAKGRDLFLVGCSFCHGQNGEGQTDKRGQNFGPPLAGVGAAAVAFQVGTGRMPMAQPGQQVPRKQPAYSEEETQALAAFVASLGPGPAIPSTSDYSLEGMTDEEKQEAISRGGQIFLTNCTACHNFQGSGGAMPRGGHAPRIEGVEPRYIYMAMQTGPQQMPTFSNNTMPPDAKRDVIAYLTALEENPDYGGFGMGGLGPVSEGMFAWVVGIGSLVGFAVWIAAATTRTGRRNEPTMGENQR